MSISNAGNKIPHTGRATDTAPYTLATRTSIKPFEGAIAGDDAIRAAIFSKNTAPSDLLDNSVGYGVVAIRPNVRSVLQVTALMTAADIDASSVCSVYVVGCYPIQSAANSESSPTWLRKVLAVCRFQGDSGATLAKDSDNLAVLGVGLAGSQEATFALRATVVASGTVSGDARVTGVPDGGIVDVAMDSDGAEAFELWCACGNTATEVVGCTEMIPLYRAT